MALQEILKMLTGPVSKLLQNSNLINEPLNRAIESCEGLNEWLCNFTQIPLIALLFSIV